MQIGFKVPPYFCALLLAMATLLVPQGCSSQTAQQDSPDTTSNGETTPNSTSESDSTGNSTDETSKKTADSDSNGKDEDVTDAPKPQKIQSGGGDIQLKPPRKPKS